MSIATLAKLATRVIELQPVACGSDLDTKHVYVSIFCVCWHEKTVLAIKGTFMAIKSKVWCSKIKNL